MCPATRWLCHLSLVTHCYIPDQEPRFRKNMAKSVENLKLRLQVQSKMSIRACAKHLPPNLSESRFVKMLAAVYPYGDRSLCLSE